MAEADDDLKILSGREWLVYQAGYRDGKLNTEQIFASFARRLSPDMLADLLRSYVPGAPPYEGFCDDCRREIGTGHEPGCRYHQPKDEGTVAD